MCRPHWLRSCEVPQACWAADEIVFARRRCGVRARLWWLPVRWANRKFLTQSGCPLDARMRSIDFYFSRRCSSREPRVVHIATSRCSLYTGYSRLQKDPGDTLLIWMCCHALPRPPSQGPEYICIFIFEGRTVGGRWEGGGGRTPGKPSSLFLKLRES